MPRKTYNADTGFALMVNLYIIKSIYYGMKKSDIFYDNSEGKKPRSVPIYGTSLPISRQRFDRINKGITFEISNREANKIVETFGIDMKYFIKDKPVMFDIPDISITDWKSFYNIQYKVGYALGGGNNKAEQKKRAERVKLKLKELAHADWEHSPDKKNPIFRVWYYFRTGERYEEESRASRCRNALENMNYKDWQAESQENLEEISRLLKKHYDYVSALMTITRLHREEKEKN